MAHTNPLYCDIDLKAPGRQLGYLRLPYSVHRSAYGQIHMPIACLGTGAGPSVVVMAGNHGDEYEGQVAISRLINELPLEQIAGRLILLPMANFPAAAAGLRTSPLDGGNLNRLFGTPAQASPTWFIADYLERVLFQGIDFFFDLHSGGSSLRYLPSMLCADDFKGKQAEQATALVEAYALPYTLMHESDADGTFASSGARRLGAVAVTTELGGAGTIQPDVMALAYDGLKRALAVTGVYRGPVTPAKGKTQRLRLDDRHYAFAAEPGVFAPLHALGHQAQKGEEAGQIHFLETPGRTPLTVTYPSNGVLLCQRVPARVERGDCLFHLAEPLDA